MHNNWTEVRDWQPPLLFPPCKEPQAKKQLWSEVIAGTNIEQAPSLASVHVTDNPVSEAMLKSMLLTLQKDLHRELQISMSQMHDRIDCLEERADSMEENMHDYSKVHNEQLDVHELRKFTT